MPIYEYECSKCFEVFEEMYGIFEDVDIIDCPTCGEKKCANKLMSKSSFRTTSDTAKGLSKHRSS